jgi:hypothetical protein
LNPLISISTEGIKSGSTCLRPVLSAKHLPNRIVADVIEKAAICNPVTQSKLKDSKMKDQSAVALIATYVPIELRQLIADAARAADRTVASEVRRCLKQTYAPVTESTQQ